MVGYKHGQLKSKSYDEIQEMFDKELKRVNTFVDMNSELVKGNNDSDVEEDTRSSQEFLVDLKQEYLDRTLLANHKRLYKRSRRVGVARTLIASSFNQKKNKGLVVESFDWDDESVELTIGKAIMAISEDESSVGRSDARSGQWHDENVITSNGSILIDEVMEDALYDPRSMPDNKILSIFEGDDESNDVMVDVVYIDLCHTPKITSEYNVA
ncbi:hypothetical protein Tco_0644672 [Tanacetum coccineum]